MQKIDTHYIPASRIASGKHLPGVAPIELAALIEHQVGQATHEAQKVTITMNLVHASALAKFLRRAGSKGL